jgi:hypothetical protein
MWELGVETAEMIGCLDKVVGLKMYFLVSDIFLGLGSGIK